MNAREGIIGDLEEAKRHTRSRAARGWIDTAIHHVRILAPEDLDVVSGLAHVEAVSTLRTKLDRIRLITETDE